MSSLHLAQNSLQKNAASLVKAVTGLGPQIVANASDSSNWGMAKAFAMEALAIGVDLSDETALQRHILAVNLRLDQQQEAAFEADDFESPSRELPVPPAPIRRDEPKVGRNEPCPCGSGKKAKKCCGA